MDEIRRLFDPCADGRHEDCTGSFHRILHVHVCTCVCHRPRLS